LLCITEVIRSLEKRSDVDRLMILCTLYTIWLMYLYPWRARPPPSKFFPFREEPEAYCLDDSTITVDCSSVESFGRVPSLDFKAAMRHSHAAVHDTFSYDRGRGAALVLQACLSRGLFEIQICICCERTLLAHCKHLFGGATRRAPQNILSSRWYILVDS
jgi:hypothetical protein